MFFFISHFCLVDHLRNFISTELGEIFHFIKRIYVHFSALLFVVFILWLISHIDLELLLVTRASFLKFLYEFSKVMYCLMNRCQEAAEYLLWLEYVHNSWLVSGDLPLGRSLDYLLLPDLRRGRNKEGILRNKISIWLRWFQRPSIVKSLWNFFISWNLLEIIRRKCQLTDDLIKCDVGFY